MEIVFSPELLDRAPGIQGDFRLACQLILQKKPKRLVVSILKSTRKGHRGLCRIIKGGFAIEVSELHPTRMLQTLIHELVHVAQLVSGRLIKATGGWIWEERYFAGVTPYAARPWEIEARVKASRALMYLEGVL